MSLYGVIGYHVTLWESHMIADHPHGVFGYHVTWVGADNDHVQSYTVVQSQKAVFTYLGWSAIMWLSQRVTW